MATSSTSRVVPVAAPMPPEMPVPNMQSPRVRAAMKVLGVHGRDLELIDKASFESELRYEVFERKRRRQIGEVAALAGRSPDSVEMKCPPSPQDAKAAMMDEIARIEHKNNEIMNRMAKKDVQKIVIQEMEAKLQAKQGQERQEGQQVRMKDLLKERDDKLKTMQKEAAKKAEKNAGVRERAVKILDEEAKEIMKKVDIKDANVVKRKTEIGLGYADFRVRNQAKREIIVERVDKHENLLMRNRQESWDTLSSRHDARMEALYDLRGQRESKTAEMQEKLDACIYRAKTHVKEVQDKKDEAYFEVLKRHDHSKETRDVAAAVLAKEYKVKNSKARQAHEQRYEKLVKDWETDHNQKEARRLNKSVSDSVLTSTFIPTNTSMMNEQMVDLVADNQRQLRKAHEYSQERALAKIDGIRDRVSVLLKSRDTAAKRRMLMMKNCATAKMQTIEKVDRVRDANPAKMMELLQALEPEPAAEERINQLLTHMGSAPIPGSAAAKAAEDGEK